MKERFKNAIRGAGGQARLAADESQSFAASVQPFGFEGDGHGAPGSGYLKSYKMFAEYNAVTQKLREGDAIIFDGRSYIIKSLSSWMFGGKSLYLEGILTLCEEEDI